MKRKYCLLVLCALLAFGGIARAQSSPNAVAQSLDPCSIWPHLHAAIPQGTPTVLEVPGVAGYAIGVCAVRFSEIAVSAAPLILSYGAENATAGVGTPCATASQLTLYGAASASGTKQLLAQSISLGGASTAGYVSVGDSGYTKFVVPASAAGSVLGSGSSATVPATTDLCLLNTGGIDVPGGEIEYVYFKPLGN